MRKLALGSIGAAALMALAVPASANAQWSHHDRDHQQLDDEHGDVHDQLEAEHANAHEQGLSPWQHAQLHRDLNNQHDEADYAVELQHQREHARDRWRRQSYGGNGYGYGNSYGYRRYHPRYRY